MQYRLECGCGRPVAVTTADAGTTIACACGEEIRVPSLSELRANAGLGAYESGAIDTIRRLMSEGTLPWGDTCAQSGLPTRDILHFHVQCERTHAAQERSRLEVLVVVLLGFWALLLTMGAEEGDARGRDTAVSVPLRLRREYHRGLARWGTQRRLRRLLRTVPIYARLLDEYPRATIRVERTSIEDDWLLE
jgi:hypothetical protein